MSFADAVLSDSSTESETSENNEFKELVEEHSPNPDHTISMVEDGSAPEDGVIEILETSDEKREELTKMYEAYRETVDFKRATGSAMGQASDSNREFEDTVEDWEGYDDVVPVDGKVLAPIYCWNRLRFEQLQDAVSDLEGNLPAYKAIYPKPQVDDLDLWIEMDSIGPDSHDSHIYCAPQVFEDFGDCQGHIPPETVSEYKAQHQFEQEETSQEPEKTEDTSESRQCAAIASTTGDRCGNDAKPEQLTCGHHDDDESRLVDTSGEDTTEQSGSDDSKDSNNSNSSNSDSSTDHGFSQDEIDAALELTGGNKLKALNLLKDME